MPNIVITERKQAIDAAAQAEGWTVTFANETRRYALDGEWEWVPANVVHFDSRGLVRFLIAAEFEDDGTLYKAKLIHFRYEHQRWTGWGTHYQWERETGDWNEFLGWINGQEKLYADLP